MPSSPNRRARPPAISSSTTKYSPPPASPTSISTRSIPAGNWPSICSWIEIKRKQLSLKRQGGKDGETRKAVFLAETQRRSEKAKNQVGSRQSAKTQRRNKQKARNEKSQHVRSARTRAAGSNC